MRKKRRKEFVDFEIPGSEAMALLAWGRFFEAAEELGLLKGFKARVFPEADNPEPAIQKWYRQSGLRFENKLLQRAVTLALCEAVQSQPSPWMFWFLPVSVSAELARDNPEDESLRKHAQIQEYAASSARELLGRPFASP